MKKHIVIFILFLFASICNSVTLVVKSKSALTNIQNIEGLATVTGIQSFDDLNQKYCCQKIVKLYKNIKDTIIAEKLGMDRVYVITLGCNAEDTAQAIRDYMETGLFKYVEINQFTNSVSHTPFIPNDPAFMWQWALHNTGNDFTITSREDIDIDMPEGWGIEQGDSSVIIAILDSGIKNRHGEFDGRLWKNSGEIPGDKIDNDNNGHIDDVYGWNFAYGDTSLADDRGHGTAVTSILGANVSNDSGLTGVNGKSKLMVLKVTDINGRAYSSSIASAIQYAADKGARVINFSHASAGKLVLVSEAIEYAYNKKVTICAGSGNNNADSVYYPAKYAHVIAVGATDPLDRRCKNWSLQDSIIGGSNYGDSLDVVAPGENIVILDYKYGMTPTKNGTSLATAFVTGLASLLISQNSDITPDLVTQIIQSTAEDQVGDPTEDTKGYDKYYGYGRINAYKALLRGEELKTGVKPKALANIELSKWITYSRSSRILSIYLRQETKNSSPVTVKVVDALGKVINSVTLPANSTGHSISLPSLSTGVYFYTIQCGDCIWSGKILN